MITSRESQHLDRKSLRKVTGSTADFGEIATAATSFGSATHVAPSSATM